MPFKISLGYSSGTYFFVRFYAVGNPKAACCTSAIFVPSLHVSHHQSHCIGFPEVRGKRFNCKSFYRKGRFAKLPPSRSAKIKERKTQSLPVSIAHSIGDC